MHGIEMTRESAGVGVFKGRGSEDTAHLGLL
jgi:hypothetical protein